ncbi:hypothetical protein J8273_3986 [Carpediemonas membranifera]|uniref:Uncharacterized protein n=1 Tax=Carpediemonas membranifera TaxID=201153 RepID=A0A8J6ATR1_9EUKA|nr:hypothetical protein J8273_3986 [Carpediemonas membranifera]|eukprot:KAG9394351.1 hypothetical protein J8273_3986 [Carpediemonas membranifera]
MELTSILMYVRNGFNSTQELFKLINNISRRLGKPISKNKTAEVLIKDLGIDMTRISGVSEALTEEERAFVKHLVPCRSVSGNTTWRRTMSGTQSRLELTNRLTVADGAEPTPFFDHDLVADHTWERPTLTLHYDSESDAVQHYQSLKGSVGIAHLGKRLNSSTWDKVETVWFDGVYYLQQAVLHPGWLESDQTNFERCSRALQDPGHVEFQPLKLLLWLDAWKRHTATFKIRIYDPSGFTFPNRITPPFRLVECLAGEKELTEEGNLQLVEEEVERIYQALIPIRGTDQVTTFDQVIVMGDHAAIRKLSSGIEGNGGHYPQPFNSIRRDHKALHPIPAHSRVTLHDLLEQKAAFHAVQADPDRVQDPKEEYGNFSDKRAIFENRPEPRVIHTERVVFCPPIMHNSHRLLEQVARLCASFPADRNATAVDKRKLQRMSSNRSIDRTVGCNEQSAARVRMANTTNEDYEALPESVQDIVRLIGYLQALYYSTEPVTDSKVAFHFLAASMCHLFHVMLSLQAHQTKLALLPPGQADKAEKPCAQTLYVNSRLTAQPLLHDHLRIPLFLPPRGVL